MSLAFGEPMFDAGNAEFGLFGFWVVGAVEVMKVCFGLAALEWTFRGGDGCIGLIGCRCRCDRAREEG